MLAADVLITDYSSMMVDFANTGRPMLFFTYDLDAYEDEIRGFYLDFVETVPGPLLRTTDEVAEALQDLDGVQRRVRRPLRRVPRARSASSTTATPPRAWWTGCFVVRRRGQAQRRSGSPRAALLRAVRAQPRAGRPRGRRAARDHHAHDRVGHGRDDPRQPQPRAPPGRGRLRGRAAQRRPRRARQPFFGDFPPGVRVVALEDRRGAAAGGTRCSACSAAAPAC